MYCPKCGKEVIEGANFCEYCGNELVKEEEEVPCIEENSINVKTRWPRKIAAGIVFLFLVVFVLFVIDKGSKSWGYGTQGTEDMIADMLIIVFLGGILYALLKS